ncbi:zinc finger protein 706-like isoform X2 [Oratosquilla oratoria]|uniref:zinc finger protein 706-like isoform X2 n=1 Tax=Oratosquilla oratoria TaxID=337810 RepID=UPI003F75ACC8
MLATSFVSIFACSKEKMARGHQKAQSQAKAQARQQAIKSKQGHSANDQKKAALKALTIQCPVCRSMMPDHKTFKQHFENKHPKEVMPDDLKDL